MYVLGWGSNMCGRGLNDDIATSHKNTDTNALKHSSHRVIRHSGFDVDQLSVDLCLQLGCAGGGCPVIHLLLDNSLQLFAGNGIVSIFKS